MIPAQPADGGQYDNHYGGSGFMVSALDFETFFGNPSAGSNRVAVWDWTGLSNLNSSGCRSCSGVNFGGQVFTGQPVLRPRELFGVGNRRLRRQGRFRWATNRADGLAVGAPRQPCPEGAINPNADNMTQVSQGQGQLWTALPTEVNQKFAYQLGDPQWRGVLGGRHPLVRQDRAVHHHQPGVRLGGPRGPGVPAMAAEGTGGNGKAIM